MPTTYVPQTFAPVPPPRRRGSVRRPAATVLPPEVPTLAWHVDPRPPRRRWRRSRTEQPTRWWAEISDPEVVLLPLQVIRRRRPPRPLVGFDVIRGLDPIPDSVATRPGTATVSKSGPGTARHVADRTRGFVAGPAAVTASREGAGTVKLRRTRQ